MFNRFFYAVLLPAQFCCAALEFRDHEGSHLDVVSDGKTLVRYMYGYDPSTPESLHKTDKPFLHVFDADGKKPITKGPGGQYTHHRGIFIGWNRIKVAGKSYDRWHMKGGCHRSPEVPPPRDRKRAGHLHLTHARIVPEGESLTVHYGFLIKDGALPEPQVIDAIWAAWAK